MKYLTLSDEAYEELSKAIDHREEIIKEIKRLKCLDNKIDFAIEYIQKIENVISRIETESLTWENEFIFLEIQKHIRKIMEELRGFK